MTPLENMQTAPCCFCGKESATLYDWHGHEKACGPCAGLPIVKHEVYDWKREVAHPTPRA